MKNVASTDGMFDCTCKSKWLLCAEVHRSQWGRARGVLAREAVAGISQHQSQIHTHILQTKVSSLSESSSSRDLRQQNSREVDKRAGTVAVHVGQRWLN